MGNLFVGAKSKWKAIAQKKRRWVVLGAGVFALSVVIGMIGGLNTYKEQLPETGALAVGVTVQVDNFSGVVTCRDNGAKVIKITFPASEFEATDTRAVKYKIYMSTTADFSADVYSAQPELALYGAVAPYDFGNELNVRPVLVASKNYYFKIWYANFNGGQENVYSQTITVKHASTTDCSDIYGVVGNAPKVETYCKAYTTPNTSNTFPRAHVSFDKTLNNGNGYGYIVYALKARGLLYMDYVYDAANGSDLARDYMRPDKKTMDDLLYTQVYSIYVYYPGIGRHTPVTTYTVPDCAKAGVIAVTPTCTSLPIVCKPGMVCPAVMRSESSETITWQNGLANKTFTVIVTDVNGAVTKYEVAPATAALLARPSFVLTGAVINDTHSIQIRYNQSNLYTDVQVLKGSNACSKPTLVPTTGVPVTTTVATVTPTNTIIPSVSITPTNTPVPVTIVVTGTPAPVTITPTIHSDPPPVSGLSPVGTINAGIMDIKWDMMNGYSKYKLRVDDTSNGWNANCITEQFDICETVNTNSFAFNFLAGHSYRIWVTVVDANGSEGPFAQINVVNVLQTPVPAIPAPTLSLECIDQTMQMTVMWNKEGLNASSYWMDISLRPDFSGNFWHKELVSNEDLLVATAPIDMDRGYFVEYQWPNPIMPSLKPNTTYYVKIWYHTPIYRNSTVRSIITPSTCGGVIPTITNTVAPTVTGIIPTVTATVTTPTNTPIITGAIAGPNVMATCDANKKAGLDIAWAVDPVLGSYGYWVDISSTLNGFTDGTYWHHGYSKSTDVNARAPIETDGSYFFNKADMNMKWTGLQTPGTWYVRVWYAKTGTFSNITTYTYPALLNCP